MRRAASGLLVALVAASWVVLATPEARPQTTELDIPVMVQTVPELPGARFSLDGRGFTADEHGLALITVDAPGTYRLEAPATFRPATHEPGGNRSARFALWSDGTESPGLDVTVDSFTHIEAGFDISYPVTPSVVGSDGDPLDGLDSVTVSDADGTETTWDGGAPLSLEGSRAGITSEGLSSDEVTYGVERIVVGNGTIPGPPGSFSPEDPGWTIEVASPGGVTISITDALLGSPAGDEVTVVFPDGQRDTHALTDGEATLGALSQGSYSVVVDGAVVDVTRRFSVPGAQRIEARLVTPIDVAVVAAVLILAALAAAALRMGAAERPSAARPARDGSSDVLTDEEPSEEGVSEERDMSRLFGRRSKESPRRVASAPAAPALAPAARDEGLAAASFALAASGGPSVDAGALTLRLQALQKDKESVEAKLQSALMQLDELRSERETSSAGLEQLARDRDALRAERDEAAADRDALHAERKELVSVRDALRAERDEATTDRDALHAERQELVSVRDALRAERDETNAERDALLRDKAGAEARIAALQQEGDAVVDRLRTEHEELSVSLEALADEADARAAELAVARADARRAESELSARVDRLSSELGVLRAEQEAATGVLAAERTEHEARVAELERDKDATNDKLKQALAQLVTASDVEAERDELRSRLEDDGRTDERLKQALGHLARTEATPAEVEGLRVEVERLRREKVALEERLSRAGRPEAGESSSHTSREAVARPPAGREAPWVPPPPRPRRVVRLEGRQRPGDEQGSRDEDTAEPWWRALLDRADKP